jgi:tetratricopeptide (TPR) repeat protein
MKYSVHRLPTVFYCILLSLAVGYFPQQSLADHDKTDLPLPVKVVLAKAAALIKQKAYDQGLDMLTAFQARGGPGTQADQRDPKGFHHPEIYFALGTCLLFKNNYQQAVQAFEQTLKKDPGHISAWLNLAKASYELNDYTRAGQCFAKAYTQAADKNPEHLYYSAAAFLMARQSKSSIDAFQRLFKNHPDKIRPEWRENFVHALLGADRCLEALPQIRWLAGNAFGEKQVQWQEILLYQYIRLEMRAQARDYALLLTKQAPARAKWWKALAHVHLQAGAFEPALTALTIYSFLEPLSAQETRLLADLHLQLGIPLKAAPLYEAVLREKTDVHLLHNLMLALQQLGRPEQALEALNRFAPASQDPELLMLKADLLYSLGHYQAAAQAYRQTAETKTKNKGRAWLMAGYAALQVNDVAQSRYAFKQAANFNQHRKAALLAIRQLKRRTGTDKRTPM